MTFLFILQYIFLVADSIVTRNNIFTIVFNFADKHSGDKIEHEN